MTPGARDELHLAAIVQNLKIPTCHKTQDLFGAHPKWRVVVSARTSVIGVRRSRPVVLRQE